MFAASLHPSLPSLSFSGRVRFRIPHSLDPIHNADDLYVLSLLRSPLLRICSRLCQ